MKQVLTAGIPAVWEEAEPGISWVQGQPRRYREPEASLSYMKPFLKKQNKNSFLGYQKCHEKLP